MIDMFEVAILTIFFFLAGIYSGHRKTFPFGHLQRLKHWLNAFVREEERIKKEESRMVLEIADVAELQKRRAQLITYTWGTSSLPLNRVPDVISRNIEVPRYRNFFKGVSIDQWIVRMQFGLDSKIFVFTPNKLVHRTTIIYQQGHEGDVLYGASTIGFFLRKGFRVVALAMPLLGPNNQPAVSFKRHGSIRLQDHNYFALLDHEYGVRSVKFFIEPVIACVNQIMASGVSSIAMIGCSGGGWTATICAAVDDRITVSFPVAGSLPFSLRRAGELADYEQHLPSLYDIVNYPEMHVLGCYGLNRRQLQILNEFDTVAWSGRRGATYAGVVQDALNKLGGGKFSVMIDSSWVGHGISKSALQRMNAELMSVADC